MSYTGIGPNELIFNNDNQNGIHSGGFSVKSIMLKEGISPIRTLNLNQSGGSSNNKFDQVSDIFNDLVVPNWALSYPNILQKTEPYINNYKKNNESDEDHDDTDIIDDDLHEKLLNLVKHYDNIIKQKKPTIKKRNKKDTKNETKRNKKKRNI